MLHFVLEFIKGSGYLLNIIGYAGIGQVYIDVLKNGSIQIGASTLVQPYTSNAGVKQARRSYGACIEEVIDNNPQFTWERSLSGGNDNFQNPQQHRPSLKDIECVLITRNPDQDTATASLRRKIFDDIKQAYNNPSYANSALGEKAV